MRQLSGSWGRGWGRGGRARVEAQEFGVLKTNGVGGDKEKPKRPRQYNEGYKTDLAEPHALVASPSARVKCSRASMFAAGWPEIGRVEGV